MIPFRMHGRVAQQERRQIMKEGEDSIKATYRNNYECLVMIKSKYDSINFSRVNQNIKPKNG
jgi:hypothetical protein